MIHRYQAIVYPMTNKLGQLEFLTFGKSENKQDGWIALYEDSTWEFGKSYMEINSNGNYIVKGGTLLLTTISGRKITF
ncbi:MAG: hypothetical protein JXR07_15530 [Reichenbachiella sp.]